MLALEACYMRIFVIWPFPAWIVFVAIATVPEGVGAAVRSRCIFYGIFDIWVVVEGV